MSTDNLIRPGDSPVFFLGASAGGVSAFKYLAEALPKDFPAPVFFLMHKTVKGHIRESLLPNILRANANLTITEPNEGEQIEAGKIYMPRLDRHIGISNNQIRHLIEPSKGLWRPSIDVLFSQAAKEYGDRAVCIILTGFLDDGVKGLNEVTERGGITVAQAAEDAEASSMPLNALIKDHPNYIIDLAELPQLMCELAQFDYFEDQHEIAVNAMETAEIRRNRVEAS